MLLASEQKCVNYTFEFSISHQIKLVSEFIRLVFVCVVFDFRLQLSSFHLIPLNLMTQVKNYVNVFRAKMSLKLQFSKQNERKQIKCIFKKSQIAAFYFYLSVSLNHISDDIFGYLAFVVYFPHNF